MIYRSSLPDVFCKKGVLKNFANFTRKHLCQSLFYIKKGLWHRCFPGNFVKFLRTAFSTEHLQWLLLDLITAYSFDICFKHLGNLGFVVHPEKSVFVPYSFRILGVYN